MITKIVNTPSIPSEYGYVAEAGFIQLEIDCINESAEIFRMLVQHDMKELQAVDEAQILALNEFSIKAIGQKIVENITKLIEKLKYTFTAATSKFLASVAAWNKVADYYDKLIKDGKWKDSDEECDITQVYTDGNKINGYTDSVVNIIETVTTMTLEIDTHKVDTAEYSNVNTSVGDIKEQLFKIGKDKSMDDVIYAKVTSDYRVKKTAAEARKLIVQLREGKSFVKELDHTHKAIDGALNKLRKTLATNKVWNDDIDLKNAEQSKKYNDAVGKVSMMISSISTISMQYFQALFKAVVRGCNASVKSLKDLASGTIEKGVTEMVMNGKPLKEAENNADPSWDDGQENNDGGWSNPAEKPEEQDDTGMYESAMTFWNSPLLEADASDFIEPTGENKSETELKLKDEKDNYVDDPSKDDGADDLMEDDDSEIEIEMESYLM